MSTPSMGLSTSGSGDWTARDAVDDGAVSGAAAEPGSLWQRYRQATLDRRTETRRTRALLLGGNKAGLAVAVAVLAVLAALWLIPFAWAVDTAFKTEAQAQSIPLEWFPSGGFTVENFRTTIERGAVFRWMANTFVIAGVTTALTVLICALAGYAFSRTRFAGQRLLLALTVGLIMIPGQILIVPLFKEMLWFSAIDTIPGVILPQLVAPAMVFIFKRFFDAIPQEIEDAARVDGASNWRLFWSVILPMSRPIVSAVAIFVFIGAWNNFMWPFIATNNPDLMTLPVGLATVKNAYGVVFAQTMASAVLGALPLIVIFMLFQRTIVKAVATTGLGGS